MDTKNTTNSISQNENFSSSKKVFEDLYALDVSEYVDKKEDLTYLSWTYAWAEAKKRFPDITYKIYRFGEKQLPYVYDENTGYMVFTEITIDGLTHSMWLPVMNSANKAMKSKPYTYDTKYKKGLIVEPATMFDVNKTIMRCLVKNLAMFGLGLYIYAGEDLPEPAENENKKLVNDLELEIEKYGEKSKKVRKWILAMYKVKGIEKLTDSQIEAAIEKLQKFSKKGAEK